MTDLYYTAPSKEAFREMKDACISVWSQYSDEHGYRKGKIDRIKDIDNTQDNFMYMLAMFDPLNQAKVIALLSQETKEAVRERLVAGGGGTDYLEILGL